MIEQYRDHCEKFAERLLLPYVDKVNKSQQIYSVKEVNDAVWQTIVLHPFDIIILDSPILQRLRHIRQLGVAHWVFPSAGHTRIEHSIGTLHLTQRLIDSIERSLFAIIELRKEKFPIEWTNLLRLAALCHDVGHGFMSHVSENSIEGFIQVEDLKLQLADYFSKEICSLAEAAAYFILGSAAFKSLIDVAVSKTKHDLPDNYIMLLQNTIISKPIHDRYPLLQEIISGPFDADKLDYMSRDAMMAGVPIVTDIPRLVQKVRITEISEYRLPKEIAKTVVSGKGTYFITGVALSGATTLDELMIGRTLLSDKVYSHQKVRTLEAMIGNIILTLSPLLGGKLFTISLLLDDNIMINLTKNALEEKVGISISPEQNELLKPAYKLSSMLRERDLFVRAYAFSNNMPRDPLKHDIIQRIGLDKLHREIRNHETRKLILEEIIKVVCQIKDLFPDEVAPDLTNNDLSFHIALDTPKAHLETSQIARAYLITGDNELLRFREDSAESSGWSNAYPMARDLGFIFSSREIAPAVFLACELVFRKLYNIRTPKSALYYTKIDKKRLNTLRRKLTENGFYKDKPRDLRAAPGRLRQADIQQCFESIIGNLRTFVGYYETGADIDRTVNVTSDRIELFLRQFDTDAEIEAVLRMIDSIKILSRADIQNGIRRFIALFPDFIGAYVCPIGSPKDSSGVCTYYVQDLAKDYNFNLSCLEVALSGEDKPILFVDDFIGSGGQVCSIINNWLGNSARVRIKEDHGPPLQDKLKDTFKKRKLGFLFICGDDNGLSELKRESELLKLDVSAHIFIGSEILPRAFNGITLPFKHKDEHDQFKERCREIGVQLLKSTYSTPREETIINNRALGYGNKSYLLVFPYNVPTQTLTLLWCGGKVDGWDWLPLVPRRAKY